MSERVEDRQNGAGCHLSRAAARQLGDDPDTRANPDTVACDKSVAVAHGQRETVDAYSRRLPIALHL